MMPCDLLFTVPNVCFCLNVISLSHCSDVFSCQVQRDNRTTTLITKRLNKFWWGYFQTPFLFQSTRVELKKLRWYQKVTIWKVILYIKLNTNLPVYDKNLFSVNNLTTSLHNVQSLLVCISCRIHCLVVHWSVSLAVKKIRIWVPILW